MTYALDTNTITFLLKDDESAIRNADIVTKSSHNLIIPKVADYTDNIKHFEHIDELKLVNWKGN